MSFAVRVASKLATLENPAAGERAEIAVDKGFNCYHWSIRGGEVDLLYADPQFLAGSSPTRTGIPILFPFPNRIRDGKYVWDGKTYELPINDPAKKNAIHGFACRRPWHVVDQGVAANAAWVTGEFHGLRDAADCRDLWPADYRLRITYRLMPGRLRCEIALHNPDLGPLPFGIGFHHYFSVGDPQECTVEVPAEEFWELLECLPTGKRWSVTGVRDLRSRQPFDKLQLDDVLTGLPGKADAEGLCLRGIVRRRDGVNSHGVKVEMHASPVFRETVVFTPPHRQAFCIEPYTCVTDAINLQQQGMDAGWLVLGPGHDWSAVVEMRAS
ncbi:MAG: aldose 1-epimerase [Planctomycetes bacterium]|nr:aldose 1-epimerase [Planctomycetota bacterium]